MSATFESAVDLSPLDARVTVTGIATLDAPTSLDAAIAMLRDAPPAGVLRLTVAGGVVTIEGSIRGLRCFDCRTEDERFLFPQSALCELDVAVDPSRYELAVALNDHLLNAAKNHKGTVPLTVETHYDEEGERLAIALRGSVQAVSYLALLIELQVTQSRFA